VHSRIVYHFHQFVFHRLSKYSGITVSVIAGVFLKSPSTQIATFQVSGVVPLKTVHRFRRFRFRSHVGVVVALDESEGRSRNAVFIESVFNFGRRESMDEMMIS
jgi:hypothetical protein